MKAKIAASLLLLSFVVSSCNKKQCPAYGSVDNPEMQKKEVKNA